MNRTGTAHRLGRSAPALLVVLFVSLLSGCEDGPSRPGQPERPAPPSPQASTAPAVSATSSAVAEAERAAPDAGTPPGTASPMGQWEGSYNARKGIIVLPPKVKDPVRQKDDGKLSTGAGTVALTIEPSGELRGTAKGALGAATLVGKVEDDIVRAAVLPDDPKAPNAMTGTLVGKLKDGAIHAELRVTGPDATLVRESTVELKQK